MRSCTLYNCRKSLRGLGTEEEEGYRTGPPGYIGWRNSFLGIDSGAPYTFKNTSSDKINVLKYTSVLQIWSARRWEFTTHLKKPCKKITLTSKASNKTAKPCYCSPYITHLSISHLELRKTAVTIQQLQCARYSDCIWLTSDLRRAYSRKTNHDMHNA